MKSSEPQNSDEEFEPFIKLIQIMREDPLINKKVISILKMNSYSRRFVLNNWLKQLQQENAPIKLTHALSILFDDDIAQLTLKLINES